MKKFIKYPSIEQFRNTIKQVQMAAQYQGKDENDQPIYDVNAKLPTLTFEGTVKLHGTNAAICYNHEDGVWAQSKKLIITPEKDNAGFAFYVEQHKPELLSVIFQIAGKDMDLTNNTISVYGEWCGGNIQKGVAINGLEKMFVVFGCKVTPHDEDKPAYWIDSFTPNNKHIHLYHVSTFGTETIEIDFNAPEKAVERLRELTQAVEDKCPAGEYFGVVGVGEGIVWTFKEPSGTLRFKVKGEKHSSSKVKTLAAVDTEKLSSIDAFVELVVTDTRLNQGIEQVFTIESVEPTKKETGVFVKWVTSDIIKEELDTLSDNGLEPKDVMGRCSKKAAQWYMAYLDKEVGL